MSTMSSEMVRVTPAIAKKFLDRNISNRKVYRHRVNQYAHSIKTGNFNPSHQGVAFDPSGNLVDGQHRLLAVIQANMPTDLYVTYNVPKEALKNIDRNRTRTLEANHQMMTGETISGKDLSAARCLWSAYCWEHFDKAWTAAVDPTEEQLIEFYHEHEYAIKTTDTLKGIKGVGSAVVRAALAASYYTVGEEAMMRACMKLEDGFVDSSDESAIIKLRDFVTSMSYGGRTERQTRYTTICGALLHYYNKRPVKRISEKRSLSFSLPFDPRFRPINV